MSVKPLLASHDYSVASLIAMLAWLLLAGCNSRGPALPTVASSLRTREPPPSAASSSKLLEGLPAVRKKAPNESPERFRYSKVGLRFTDVHDELGLNFVFDNGKSRARLMLESTSGGVGWLDYDGDGWWDLYLPQGGNPFTQDEPQRSSNDELYANREGRQFVRVTNQAGLRDVEFGHGVAIGDFDNDGFDDIYVTNVGPDILYHNAGDGTFREVTQQAGIHCPAWSSSAAWADLDLDGDLDLYVCTYVDYDPRHPHACLTDEGTPGICHPDNLGDVPDQCYFNLGDGTFEEVARERGFVGPGSKSLGVAIADFNGDRLPDVFVANDTAANHLFLNVGDAHFEERAIAMGCAMSGQGHYQANMGVGFGDYDENGFPDLYSTTFTKDSNTLFANFGPSGFEDVTRKTNLHVPTLPYLGFGTVMSDFDHNGRQELFIANGHIDDWRDRNGDLWYMPAQLFTFNGSAWDECGPIAGPYFQKFWLGRGVASADFDEDGDLDLAVVHQNDPIGLLRNDSDKGHYLKFRFIGQQSNRRGIGVRVTVTQAGRRLVQQLPGGTSYCASHQPVLFFGLGESSELCQITVDWPNGRQQTMTGMDVDRRLVVDEMSAQEP